MGQYIKSPINYVGNKYKLLPQMEPLFPQDIDTFVDVFGGSGTVLINTQAKQYIYNDINHFVADIFEGIITQTAEDTIAQVDAIIAAYDLSKINKKGFEQLRNDYNNGKNDWVTLYTLMCYSFNWQMRFNSEHKYNSSWGKDRSSFTTRQREAIKALKTRVMGNVTITHSSFEAIDFSALTAQDFAYFDPPYLSSTGNYNDGKRGFEGWTKEHEVKLLDLLTQLNTQGVRFALSNNLKYDNPYLQEWLDTSSFCTIHSLNKSYSNCSYHKKDRTNDEEVLIVNY